MRYTIYKGKEEKVGIEQEVKYLEDYIELQMLRLHQKLRYTFSKDIEDDSYQIAPLLLIVLVENAFKHGIEPAEEHAFLNLSLHCTANTMEFTCQNSFEQTALAAKPGIGLINLRKRLMLLYPNTHNLTLSAADGIFKVKIDLA